MRKYKLCRILPFITAGVVAFSYASCSGSNTSESENPDTSITTTYDVNDDVEDSLEISIVDNNNNTIETTTKNLVELENNIKNEFGELDESIVENTSIIMMLDEIAPKDENDKINTDIIEQFKNRIDSTNMMSDFNSFIDILENRMVVDCDFVRVSDMLLYSDEAMILSKIEDICLNIKNLSADSKNKEQIKSEFNKIYSLFVEEKDLTIDGITFCVRNLNYADRAMAQAYARAAAYYAKEYISEQQKNDIDRRTNDQNNKAYIKTELEILSNSMNEKSEIDVLAAIEDKKSQMKSYGLDITDEEIETIIGFINIQYLNSDKVSTKDRKEILGTYSDDKMINAIGAINNISNYNNSNPDNLLVWSDYLIDDYKNTKKGQIDSITLDYVLFNSLMLNKTVLTYEDEFDILSSEYFKNLHSFIIKSNFDYSIKDENGSIIEGNINYQNVSDGVKFIGFVTLNNVLNKYPEFTKTYGYDNFIQNTILELIQGYQNIAMGECEKIDDVFELTLK